MNSRTCFKASAYYFHWLRILKSFILHFKLRNFTVRLESQTEKNVSSFFSSLRCRYKVSWCFHINIKSSLLIIELLIASWYASSSAFLLFLAIQKYHFHPCEVSINKLLSRSSNLIESWMFQFYLLSSSVDRIFSSSAAR